MNLLLAGGVVEVELVYEPLTGALELVQSIEPPEDVWTAAMAGGEWGDLQAPEEWFPETARWFVYEVRENGIADLIGAGYSGGADWSDPNRDERWLLTQGIAPGQRFRVRIDPTEYTGPDHNGEYDSYAGGWEVVWIEPLPPAVVKCAWRAWLLGQPEGPNMLPPFEERRHAPDGLVTVYEKRASVAASTRP